MDFKTKYNNPLINLVYAASIHLFLVYAVKLSFDDSLVIAEYCYAVSISNAIFSILRSCIKQHIAVQLIILPLIIPTTIAFVYFFIPSLKESIRVNGLFLYFVLTIFSLIPTIMEKIDLRKKLVKE